jgi:K+-sensing histidine kinase KdpD
MDRAARSPARSRRAGLQLAQEMHVAKSSIVCAIDGSTASSEAARLARAIARRVGASLDLVVLRQPSGGTEQLRRAERLRAELAEDIGPAVVLRIATGSAAEQLIRASRDVGSRPRRGPDPCARDTAP